MASYDSTSLNTSLSDYSFPTSCCFFLCALQNPLNGLSVRTKKHKGKKYKAAYTGADAIQCLEDSGISRSAALHIATHLLEANFIQFISGRQANTFQDDPNTYYTFNYTPSNPRSYLSKSSSKAATALLAIPTKGSSDGSSDASSSSFFSSSSPSGSGLADPFSGSPLKTGPFKQDSVAGLRDRIRSHSTKDRVDSVRSDLTGQSGPQETLQITD